MRWNKTAALAATVLCAMLVAVGCDKPPTIPDQPTGPDTTWTGVQTTYTTVATAGGEIKYVFDWDGATDTSGAIASGTQYGASHTWTTAGTYDVKAMALLAKNTGKASDWSEAKSVVVIQNDGPVLDSVRTSESGYGSVEADVPIRVWGHDPNGDSLRFYVRWKSTKTESSAAWTASPGRDSFFYAYSDTGVYWIKAWAVDTKGATSAADSVQITIGVAGGVLWYWVDYDGWPLATSPLVVWNGTDTVVCAGCDDVSSPGNLYSFYSLKVNSHRVGEQADRASTRFASEDETWFSGHAAYLSQYDHIIVGSDEGELYALKPDGLDRKWTWPESTLASYTGDEFGPAAISGDKIYAGREEGAGAIYLFQDRGDGQDPLYVDSIGLTSAVVDAPVINSAGDVFFSTDSGYLYKAPALLNQITWSLQFPGTREVYGPVIGSDGMLYVTTDQRKLMKVDPSTNPPTVPATYTMNGIGMRPVIGQSAVFVGTDFGTVYAFNSSLGVVWQKNLSDAVSTAPILVQGGLMYVQTDDDKLYCLSQTDGAQQWVCDCAAALPRHARRARPLGNSDISPSPTITGRGNIIVTGADAAYCVKGYPDKLLDATAPWPKWMKNVYNTGK